MRDKFKILERLAQQGASSASGTPVTGSVLSALQEALAADAGKAVEQMQQQLAAKQKECDRMCADMAKLQEKLEAALRATTSEVTKARSVEEAKMASMHGRHEKEMGELKSKLMAIKKELDDEYELRVKAESEYAAECKVREQLERLVNTLQTAKSKPVPIPEVKAIMPAASPMKPLSMVVTRRDMSGRIAEISITPSS